MNYSVKPTSKTNAKIKTTINDNKAIQTRREQKTSSAGIPLKISKQTAKQQTILSQKSH